MPSMSVRLTEARVKRGLSKDAAAKELGVSVNTLRSWESGTKPKEHQVARLAAFLGEQPMKLHVELFGGSDA